MKNIVIFTSVLALAACGGGSGSGGAGSIDAAPIVPAPVDEGGMVTAAARNSNREVTKMVSEILVPNHDASPIVARAASGNINMNGKEYTSYRLDDVKFVQAGLNDQNEYEKFKFHVNGDGQIDKIVYDDGWTLDRQSDDTAVFDIKDDDTTGTAELKTYGTLKYADFGIMHLDQVEDGEPLVEDMAFAGGYDVMSIDKDKVQQDVEFIGRAVGGVVTEYDGNGDKDIPGLALDTNDAKLTFANGVETLNMNFDNWYDVKITKEGDVASIEFTNDKGIDDNYKFKQEKYTDFTKNATEYWEDGVRGMYESNLYGEKGLPSEATAVTFIGESCHENGTLRETNFNAAFGGATK